MKTSNMPLWWTWSLRDLRQNRVQVLGIAVIIALGVAMYSGLSSYMPWRTTSLNESYAMLNMFDLKLDLTQGSYLEAETLENVINSIPHAEQIKEVELRLAYVTTLDASTPGQSVLVSGQLFGVDVRDGGPHVNRLYPTSGRGLQASDAGQPVCIVEQNFANYYDLQPGDRELQISGGQSLQAVSVGMSAEHFMVLDDSAGVFGLMAQDRLAALFCPLETVQEAAGLPGQVNQALITTVEGLDEQGLDQLRDELKATMAQALPQVGLEVEKAAENSLYRMLYDDIPGDQQMYDMFSFALLLGAAFGAFILVGRIVDSQRREIGINMALGVTPWRIAGRYMLVGAQVALLGTVMGLFLGVLLNPTLGKLLSDAIPTPYFETTFEPQVFVRGALVGILIPFLAIVYPIWRAVRVAPVDAIQTGYLVSKGGGLAPLLARLPLGWLPGSSLTLLPLRNLSRGVRRTVMTALALAMSIVVLILVVGLIDSILGTLDRGSAEVERDTPDRTLIMLDNFYSSDFYSTLVDREQVEQIVPTVMLPGRMMRDADGDQELDVFIQMLDLDNDLWTPTILRGGTESDAPGVLITDKAARDLGVDVGDDLSLWHPYRESQYAWRMEKSTMRVMGIHPDIMRTIVYMDIRDTGLMNLQGSANSLYVKPAAGVSAPDLRYELFPVKEVASVQRASAAFESIKGMLYQFMGVFQVVKIVVLVMAFFIAFNTTRSNMDERRRDLATMFAFGTPVSTVVRMAMVENLVVGLLGTVLGMALGAVALDAMWDMRVETMFPDLNAITSIAPATFGWAIFIGAVVVALTPVLVARRLAGMDIPSTLRVLE